MRAWKEKGRSSDVHLIVWIYPRLATKADGLQHPQTQTPAFRHTQTRVQTFRHDPGHTIAGERCCQARQNQERAHAHAHLRLSREPHQGRQRGRRPVRAPRTPHTKDTPTCATDSHRPRRPRARTQPATQPRGWAGSAGSQGSAPGSRRCAASLPPRTSTHTSSSRRRAPGSGLCEAERKASGGNCWSLEQGLTLQSQRRAGRPPVACVPRAPRREPAITKHSSVSAQRVLGLINCICIYIPIF